MPELRLDASLRRAHAQPQDILLPMPDGIGALRGQKPGRDVCMRHRCLAFVDSRDYRAIFDHVHIRSHPHEYLAYERICRVAGRMASASDRSFYVSIIVPSHAMWCACRCPNGNTPRSASPLARIRLSHQQHVTNLGNDGCFSIGSRRRLRPASRLLAGDH